MPKHTCALCGQISFSTYREYEAHRSVFHGLKTEIKPENVTGRSPRQIVEDAERTWLKPYLIVNEGPLTVTASNDSQHLDACRCNDCFNKKLDALIASQEAALKDQGVNHAS
jgi:hypothetical protein